MKNVMKFIWKRLYGGFLIILGVVLSVFFIFHALPGDPSRMIAPTADAQTVEIIKQELGLDLPLHRQLIYYLNDLSPISAHKNTPENLANYEYIKIADFGENVLALKTPYMRRSFMTQKKVTEILTENFEGTVWLTLAAIAFATFFGILFGLLSAIYRGSWIDHSLMSISILGISTPSFVAAILISMIFGFYLSEWTGLPLQGSLFVSDLSGKKLMLKNLILPTFTLGIRPLAIIAQLTRSSMTEVLRQDYIRTARAKGLSGEIVILKHALRNALNPVITAVSGWMASLLAGAFFVEYIFGWKGLGWITINSVYKLDFPVVMGSTILVATVFVFINIFVDIFYAIVDPRVKIK
jgi:peptide/nickel transport system permease protein